MQLILLIGKEQCFVYEKRSAGYEKQYIGGHPGVPFELQDAQTAVEFLVNDLVEEFNLSDKKELTFTLITNEDVYYTKVIEDELVKQEIEVKRDDVNRRILDVLNRLQTQSGLLVDKYGINFDGKCYQKAGDKKLWKKEFSLLAYTVDEDEFMSYQNQEV